LQRKAEATILMPLNVLEARLATTQLYALCPKPASTDFEGSRRPQWGCTRLADEGKLFANILNAYIE